MTGHVQPSARFSRVLSSRLDEIALLAQALEDWGDEAGVAPAAIAHMNLMLDELITNIVQHGYRGQAGGHIGVEAQATGGALQVELTDHAFAWDPLQGPAVDTTLGIDEREIGGLGIHFVRTLADELEYARLPEGAGPAANRLRIVKRYPV
ncbi:MAG TPA: ATP-binding protein [Ramlibacter sp.]|nr:ATP-binding protein [Ramlibacter sp.]